MMNLDKLLYLNKGLYECKYLEASFSLSKIDVLEALKHDFIIFNDVLYHTPKEQLTDIFLTESYGVIKLKLKESSKE